MSILSNFNETTSICNTCIHNGKCRGTVCYGYESEQHRMSSDLISRAALKEAIETCDRFACLPDTKLTPFYRLNEPEKNYEPYVHLRDIKNAIDNAPAVEKTEEPFITECRDTAIKENLPLYFVYYEETGILEVYVTETKELFEKRHCSKHLPDYEFKEAVTRYLDWYSDWKDGAE